MTPYLYRKKTAREIYLARILEEEQIVLSKILEEDRNINFESSGGDSDTHKINTNLISNTNFNLWNFSEPSGATINDVSLSFASSINVQINWGDSSVETVYPDTNYSHTFI